MTEMEPPVRARSEAENGLRHGCVSGDGGGMESLRATILDSDAALKAGVEALSRTDTTMAGLLTRGVKPMLRKRPAGFEGLASVVVGQQVSTASAAAIWNRFSRRFGPIDAATVIAASDEDLRSVGLSGAKIRTLRTAAAAVENGSLQLDRLQDLSADEAHRCLVAVKGIGPWTADVYLLFCLGHADAFPAGDLALQEAARAALGLDRRPDSKTLTALAEDWRPWRGVAAKVLWAYYRIVKARDGAPT
jgi:DNA-3-methyladenine glycosylase II